MCTICGNHQNKGYLWCDQSSFTLFCFLPSVVVCLVTLSTPPDVKFLSITFSMLCLFSVPVRLAATFSHHLKDSSATRSTLCHHPKQFLWRKSIDPGQRLILASCELLIKKKNHDIWPWQLPLRHIASTSRQVTNNIAGALSSSSPHGIREHKNVKYNFTTSLSVCKISV